MFQHLKVATNGTTTLHYKPSTGIALKTMITMIGTDIDKLSRQNDPCGIFLFLLFYQTSESFLG